MNFKKMTTGEKIYTITAYVITALLVVIIIMPIISVLSTSFVSEAELARRGEFILWPEKPSMAAYQMVFNSPNIWQGYKNTLFVVTVGTTMSMLTTIGLAYPLSKRNLRGRTPILAMMTFTMLFSGGTVPTYLTVNFYGLLDTRWALILPSLLSTWNTLLMRNFFYSIPESLEEAAYLDGATQIQVLWKIVLPLSLPSIATIGMFYGVGYWNAWFPGTMYITKAKLLPIQNITRAIVEAATASQVDMDVAMESLSEVPPSSALKNATIIVSTIPILCVYPFIQKYFVKGVMVGSVKG